MSKTDPRIAVVILNWNGLQDTLHCIDSLKKQLYKNFQVVVVDNASDNNEYEHLSKIEGIKAVQFDRNYGFAGGHLRALEHIDPKYDYVVLLNNDLVADKVWLRNLVQGARKMKAAIAGGRSYVWNKENPAFKKTNDFYSYQVIDPVSAHAKTLQSGTTAGTVNSISGASLLVSREAIERVGYLDDDFFAYYEESDLIARAKRAGMTVAYIPDAMTWHKIGASSQGEPYFYLYQMQRNRFLFAYKNFDRKYLTNFVKLYRKEFLAALKGRTNGDKSDANKAVINAYLWNMRNLPRTKKKRGAILKLGNSYNELLVRASELNEDVTIVIPCYNYAQYIKECLDSVVEQTLKPARVIVIDDGSTDDSADIIRDTLITHKESCPGISFEFIQKSNSGVVDTKNLGLRMVKTEWTIFLDADDILEPEYIESTLTSARLKKADIVYTDMRYFGAFDGRFKAKKFDHHALKHENFIHNSALIRTSLLNTVGGYSPYMSGGYEDWELYLKLSKLTDRFEYVKLPLLNYRQHPSSMSRNALAEANALSVRKKVVDTHPDLYNYAFDVRNEITFLRGSYKQLYSALYGFGYIHLRTPYRIARHTYHKSIIKLDQKLSSHPTLHKSFQKIRRVKHSIKIR